MTVDSTSATSKPSSSTFERLAYRHGFWAVAGRALNVAVTAVSGILLARNLSAADFGKISVIQTAVSISSVAASLGLGVAALRLLAQARLTGTIAPTIAVVKRIRSIILLFVSTAAVVIGAIIYQMSDVLFWESTSINIGFLIACGIFLRAVQAILAEMSRGLNEVRFSNLLAGWNGGPLQNILFLTAVSSAAIFSTVTWKWALVFDVVAMATSVAIGVFFLQRTLVHYVSEHCNTFQSSETLASPEESHRKSPIWSSREILVISLPIMLTSLVAFAIEQGDIVLGGFVCSEADLPF